MQHRKLFSAIQGALLTSTFFSPALTHAASGDDAVLSTVKVVEKDVVESTLINQGKPASTGKLGISVQDTPASIAVIDKSFIADTGAKNIQDALLYTAGVQSGNYGFDTRGDWAVVRGLDASFYQDGLRTIYGYYNSARTNAYALERLEVLKGPSSTLYGQSELGGIVNAVSKLPQAQRQGEVWAQVGSFDRRQIAGDVTGPLTADGTWLYRAVALTRDSDTQVDHVNDDGYVIAPSLTWKPQEGTTLTLLVNRQEDEGQVSAQFLPSKGTIDPAPRGRLDTDTFVGEPGWDRYDTERTDVTLFVDQALSEQWKASLTARHTESSVEVREHWAVIPGLPDDAGNIGRTIYSADTETNIDSFDLRTAGHFEFGPTRHTLAIGVDYQDALWETDNVGYGDGGPINLYDPVYDNLQAALLVTGDANDNRIRQTGLYVMDHIEMDRFIISAALRYDDSKSTTLAVVGANTTAHDKETTGRIGLMYKFDNGISPYISYAEAFVPNLGADTSGGPGSGKTLDPTTGKQNEAGLKYLAPAQDLSIAFAWFDIEQENHVGDGLTPGGASQTGATVEGWELEVKKSWGPVEVVANYTDLDARDESIDERLSAVAEKFGSVWTKYELANGFRFGLGLRYTGDTVGYGGSPVIDSVTQYDAMLGYAFGNWDFSLDGKNLGDEVYVSWCRYEGADCGYGERRTWSGNVRYKF
ncbi:MAG: TonB-dependent siderophore receptor [Spongiibacteraceae bacterium]